MNFIDTRTNEFTDYIVSLNNAYQNHEQSCSSIKAFCIICDDHSPDGSRLIISLTETYRGVCFIYMPKLHTHARFRLNCPSSSIGTTYQYGLFAHHLPEDQFFPDDIIILTDCDGIFQRFPLETEIDFIKAGTANESEINGFIPAFILGINQSLKETILSEALRIFQKSHDSYNNVKSITNGCPDSIPVFNLGIMAATLKSWQSLAEPCYEIYIKEKEAYSKAFYGMGGIQILISKAIWLHDMYVSVFDNVMHLNLHFPVEYEKDIRCNPFTGINKTIIKTKRLPINSFYTTRVPLSEWHLCWPSSKHEKNINQEDVMFIHKSDRL